MFGSIAVFGMGLLGGSFCRAVKRHCPESLITGIARNPEKLKKALNEENVDSLVAQGKISDLDLSSYGLIIISVPVKISINIIREILDNKTLNPEAVVIDFGSVKEEILKSLENHTKFCQFIGCHPMAGSEKTGYDSSSEDLFQGASFIITPNEHNKKTDIQKIKDLWTTLGSRVVVVDSHMHDLSVSYTSHIPHIVSAALVNLTSDERCSLDDIRPFIGSGFYDMTRIASGSVPMWKEIVELNKENIAHGIDKLIKSLDNFKRNLLVEDYNEKQVDDYLTRAVEIKKELGL